MTAAYNVHCVAEEEEHIGAALRGEQGQARLGGVE